MSIITRVRAHLSWTEPYMGLLIPRATLFGVAILLLCVIISGIAIPQRRVIRIDPIQHFLANEIRVLSKLATHSIG